MKGYIPIIVENELVGDELRTDLKALGEKITELTPEKIACIFSTTSCFAPRAPDKVEEIAVLAKKYEIFHVINNAYGLQSSKCTHIINQASRVGRVDVVVQSTDKKYLIFSYLYKQLELASCLYNVVVQFTSSCRRYYHSRV